MKIAIVHYHLNRGGVAQVVANHLSTLDAAAPSGEKFEVAVLFDGQQQGWPSDLPSRLTSVDLTLCPVPELAYDQYPVTNVKRLASALSSRLGERGFLPDETLLHVHNHSLGKNVSMPGAIAALALKGYASLLQIHDFAEDFRPANYRFLNEAIGRSELGSVLYPQASHIHYAVLNRRDERVLGRAGVAPERLHWLPNPVPEFREVSARERARDRLEQVVGVPRNKRYALYPVRGIRRKNVGEAILWSALAGDTTEFAVTLAPLNPRELPFYDGWRRFAAERALPFRFETGAEDQMAFSENLAAADVLLTTSVAEGFGMVFLESWLAGRPLVGRDLPEITADFVEAGLKLDGLYPHLQIPLDWVAQDQWHTALRSAYRSAMQEFGQFGPDARLMQEMIEQKTEDGYVDFGDLDEPLQKDVIQRVIQDASCRRMIRDQNERLVRVFSGDEDGLTDDIAYNQQVIREQYAMEPSGRRLLALYQNVLGSHRDSQIEPVSSAGAILDRFLDFNRFRLIRS